MKLLIVDDHPVVLEGISNVMKREGYDVLKAQEADQALAIASENSDIDIFIVDLALKEDTDGLALITELKTCCEKARTIVYTMHGESWNLRTLYEAGVEGIVLKGDSIEELLEAVRAVETGSIYRSKEFTDRYNAISSVQGIMSKSDLNVLRLISDGANSKDIADSLCLSEKAVEYHRSNILKKLGSNNMAQAINKAVRLGILTCITAIATATTGASATEPEVIDLGLSVKWADRNLGAASPLEAGGYYSFGEVEEKDYYTWDTYLYGGMYQQEDFKVETLGGSEYDPAHLLLGGKWRMPTMEEAQELIDNCEREYVTAEPNYYLRLTAPNGVELVMPLAGTKSKGDVNQFNRDMAIWTGSFEVEEGEDDGFFYHINGPFMLGGETQTGRLDVLYGNPFFGLQIRPVYDEPSSVANPAASSKKIDAVYSIDGKKISGDVSTLPSGIYIYRYSDGTSKRQLK